MSAKNHARRKRAKALKAGESQVPKRRLALIQLHRSLDLLVNHNDPVCALTLAAAAEEILGRIAAKKGRQTALEERAHWLAGMGRLFKRPEPSQSKIYQVHNRARNEFKHNDGGRNLRVRADFVFEAEDMILRAIRNYRQAFGCFPGSELVRDWWYIESL